MEAMNSTSGTLGDSVMTSSRRVSGGRCPEREPAAVGKRKGSDMIVAASGRLWRGVSQVMRSWPRHRLSRPLIKSALQPTRTQHAGQPSGSDPIGVRHPGYGNVQVAVLR